MSVGNKFQNVAGFAKSHPWVTMFLAFNLYAGGNWAADTDKEFDQINPNGSGGEEILYTYKDSAADITGAAADATVFTVKALWSIGSGAVEGVFGKDKPAPNSSPSP